MMMMLMMEGGGGGGGCKNIFPIHLHPCSTNLEYAKYTKYQVYSMNFSSLTNGERGCKASPNLLLFTFIIVVSI